MQSNVMRTFKNCCFIE